MTIQQKINEIEKNIQSLSQNESIDHLEQHIQIYQKTKQLIEQTEKNILSIEDNKSNINNNQNNDGQLIKKYKKEILLSEKIKELKQNVQKMKQDSLSLDDAFMIKKNSELIYKEIHEYLKIQETKIMNIE